MNLIGEKTNRTSATAEEKTTKKEKEQKKESGEPTR